MSFVYVVVVLSYHPTLAQLVFLSIAVPFLYTKFQVFMQDNALLEKAVGQILKCGMMMMIWWQQLSCDTIIECGWALWKIGFIFLCFFMEDVFVRLNIAIVWNKIILLMCICAYIYVYYVCNIILQDVFSWSWNLLK